MARDNSIDAGAITTRLRTLSDEMPLTVLVVDDDELERALISDRLEYRGFQVAQAGNGSEALDLLDAQTIQVPELLARVHTAVTTWSLRRELRETRAASAAATGDKSPQA
jgi:CheY-like chemotaxis protein